MNFLYTMHIYLILIIWHVYNKCNNNCSHASVTIFFIWYDMSSLQWEWECEWKYCLSAYIAVPVFRRDSLRNVYNFCYRNGTGAKLICINRQLCSQFCLTFNNNSADLTQDIFIHAIIYTYINSIPICPLYRWIVEMIITMLLHL